jgi:hypothetical protein
MNIPDHFFNYFGYVGAFIMLLILGYSSFFRTQKVIDYYASKDVTGRIKEKSKQKSYQLKFKILGIIYFVLAGIFLIYIICKIGGVSK